MEPNKEEKNRPIDPEKGLERVRRKRTRKTVGSRVLTAVTVFGLVAAFAVLVIGVFFRVSEIRVVGNTYYNDQDIIDASGIENGRNIYLIDPCITTFIQYLRNYRFRKIHIRSNEYLFVFRLIF